MFIIKDKSNFNPLMGRTWLDILYPQWRGDFKINVINLESEFEIVESLRTDFANAFNSDRTKTISNIKVNVVLKDNVTPIFSKPYQTPYAIKELVEKELRDMVKDGILVPVKHSEWASPIVIVPRKSGKSIRICVDFKNTLNPNVMTEHYPIPLMEDTFIAVSGGIVV